MRSIFKYQPIKHFSTNRLSQVIQSTAESIKQQQTNNYIKYEDIFFNLYSRHLARQKKLNINVKKLDAICMMGDFPCRSIVEHFLATAKTYSEEYTVQTFVRLSRAYKISQADNSSTADFSINRLFFTPAFQNLIQQYKYGLRKQHAMTWDNAFLVAQCLIDIGYVDYQVFSILLNMVESKLNKKPRNSTEIRTFQIQKKDYYMSRLQSSQQNLVNDPEFQAVLKMLSEKVKRHELDIKKQQNLKQLQSQLSVDEKSKDIYHEILESISLIETYNQNLTKLIEGIITIRKQYRKMTQLSENKDILRNPEFNLELLQLEQMLLIKKLISMNDIKNPSLIQNQELELKRVEQILISMIQPQNATIQTSELTDYLNSTFSEGESKENLRQVKLKQIAEYGRAMSVLTKLAEVSRRVYNAPDARSLVSMKWQKTLLNWNKGGSQTNQWQENLHAEKIFRRTFSDIYQMVKRCYSIFMFTFIEAPLKYKLQFFESLTRLGYHTQLINLLENEELGKQKVETYSNQEFTSLIKVLNEIGHKIFAQNLKKSALRHLKKVTEESEFQQQASLFTMEFCTNAINFICQNYNVQTAELGSSVSSKDEMQVLYDTLISKLALQTKYYEETSNFLTNDHLYQAYRILSIERAGEFKLNKYWNFRFNINANSQKDLKDFFYKKNPFHSIVQELCDQYATSPLNRQHPFMMTGFNPKGELTAVLLCSSNESSMDGKFVTGNTNAYISRVKREFNISITPLCVNSLLQIDYEKTSQNQEFTFKSKDVITKTMEKLFKKDELHLLEFSETLSNIALVLEKHYKKSYLYALVKFLNTLNECIKLYSKEKDILFFQLFKFRRYRLFIQMDTLKEDYNLIDKSVKEDLEKMWKKETSNSSSEFLKKNQSVLSFVESIQNRIMSSLDNKNLQSIEFTKKSFEGKRFSIQTFIQSDIEKENIGIEFINSTTYIDKTFCPYSDWLEALKKVYPLQSIKLSESSNIIKILVNKFLPLSKQELTVLPFEQKSRLSEKPQFHINSLQPLKKTQNQQNQEHKTQLSDNQLQEVKALLEFIHQIKMSKSQEQVIEYILSFDFIYNTHLKPIEKSHIGPLPRNNLAYFNFLEASNNKIYLESPNLEYLLNKLDQREEISQIFNARKQRRYEAKMQYQLAEISRKDFIEKCEKIDDQIITKLRTLDKNVLDNVEEYRILQNGLKMVKIEKDQKELERILNRARYYYRILDKDFVHVKGNVERCLKIKRGKAQRMLALYKVLYKLGKGQFNLSQIEREVLKKQATSISFRLENKKDHIDSFNQKFTSLTIGDLTKTDKDRLKLQGTDLSAFKSLPLTDLILELVNLLDPKVYEGFERSIVKKFYSSNHGLPEELFVSGLNKQFTKLAHEEERQIINEKSILNSYDLGLIDEMIKTFKTESKTGKQRFAQIYDSFYEDIQVLNDSQARVELITEYLAQKESEYEQDYNPKLVSETKQREVMKLWLVLFKKSYHQSDSELIRSTVNKLCQRIRIMGDVAPPFFGLLVIRILQHPQTDILTKQNLISNLAQFKTPLNVDSQDVRLLGEACSEEERDVRPSSQKIIEQIGLISNKNFMEKLSKKINMIV